jgi:hypothetical protein
MNANPRPPELLLSGIINEFLFFSKMETLVASGHKTYALKEAGIALF